MNMIDEAKEIIKDPSFKKLIYSISVGSVVSGIHDMSWSKIKAGDIGIVTEVILFSKNNPIQDHGFVSVKFLNGVVEDFTHYRWPESLELIELDFKKE